MRDWIKNLNVEALGFLRCDPNDKWRLKWNREEPKNENE